MILEIIQKIAVTNLMALSWNSVSDNGIFKEPIGWFVSNITTLHQTYTLSIIKGDDYVR